MQWNKFLPKLEALEENGRTMKAMEEMPEVAFFLEPVWSAYIELHNRRTSGFEMNPIAVGEITDWLNLRRYEDAEVREFIFDMVCFLDDQWRKLTTKGKRKKKPPKVSKGGK